MKKKIIVLLLISFCFHSAWSISGKNHHISLKIKQEIMIIERYIENAKLSIERDNDSIPEIIKELDELRGSFKEPASLGIASVMKAQFLQLYLSQKAYQIEGQTDLNYTPDDMRIWSTNNFIDSILSTIKEGQTYNKCLTKLGSNQFKKIIQINELTPYYSASLYEYLTLQNLGVLENIASRYSMHNNQIKEVSLSLLKDLIEYEKSTNNTSAAINAEIKKIHWTWDNSKESFFLRNQALDDLRNVYYKDTLPGTEWIIEKVDLLENEDCPILFDNKKEKQEEKAKTEEIYNLLQIGIKNEPNHPLSNKLRNLLSTMTTPYLSIDNSTLIYPGDDIEINITTRNIPNGILKIYYFNVNSEGNEIPLFDTYKLEEGRIPNNLELIKSELINFPKGAPWEEVTNTFSWNKNREGLYFVTLENSDHNLKTASLFNISTLNCNLRQINNDQTEIQVVDAKSGEPLKKATISVYTTQKRNNTNLKKIDHISTNEYGIASIPYYNRRNTLFTITYGKSFYAQPKNFWTSQSSDTKQAYSNKIQIFTDRSIYRPGQIVYFKGIITRPTNQYLETVKNQSVTVVFKDTNNKDIAKFETRSNEFGSFDGSFKLPKNVLNGYFTIQCGTTWKQIQVEEYKRPNFFLSISLPNNIILLDQPTKIEGSVKSFSQANLSDVSIEYYIIREEQSWREQNAESLIAEGKTRSNENGVFSFKFTPTSKGERKNEQFSIRIKATDLSGETQELYQLISISKTPYSLTSSLKKENNDFPHITSDSLSFNIYATTLQGKTLDRDGKYRLYRMVEPKQNYSKIDPKCFSDKKLIRNGIFSTNEKVTILNPNKLPSGFYCLEMETKEDSIKVIDSEYFVLYDPNQKEAVNNQFLFYNLDQTTVQEGKDIDLFISSGNKELYLLIENLTTEGIKFRNLVKLSNESKRIKLNIPKQNSNTTQILLSFFKDQEYYFENIQLQIEHPNQNLSIYPNTFRDLTLPGAKETWSFSIKDHKNQAVIADVLATMYDQSLDAIAPHYLYYNTSNGYKQEPYININIRGLKYQFIGSQYKDEQYYDLHLKSEQLLFMKDFGFYGFDRYERNLYKLSRGNIRSRRKLHNNIEEVAQEMMAYNTIVTDFKEDEKAEINTDEASIHTSKNKNNVQEQKVPIRKNLNETAFFYPTLRTDSTGNVSFAFTLPESNTTWKFNLLAHTADYLTGLWNKKVITQKNLMVLPNRPKFLRQGDKTSISVQVLNQSEKEIKGSIQMELYDPETNLSILKKEQKQKFVINKQASKAYTFEVELPKDIAFIGCRFIANSAEGSDGEQAIIPVLPANVTVTESLPFFLGKEDIKRFEFKIKSSGTKDTQIRKTIEVSTNPISYVFAALPSVTQNQSQDIISKLYRSYAYLLAANLVQNSPALQNQITLWSNLSGFSDNASPLSNNEDLKKLTIEETPWLSADLNEKERLANLIMLTDINRNQEIAQRLIEEIKKAQHNDGGWSWFPGGQSSFRITLSVAEKLHELSKRGYYKNNEQITAMISSAIKRLDGFALEINRTNNHNDYSVSSTYIQYLILRKQFKQIPISNELAKINNDKLRNIENNYKKYSFSNKILAGLLFAEYNNQEKVEEIVHWLRKTSTTQEDRGMFWVNNRSSFYYNTSSIYLHTQIIKLFRECGSSEKEMNALYQWLISEKRAQNWENSPTTINVVEELLNFTHQQATTDNNTVIVNWGKTKVDSTEKDSMGYTKTSQEETKEHYTPSASVELKGQGPIWGALYAQYEEPITSVQSHESILKTEKELLLLSSKGEERFAKRITDGTVNVGDKILVRLTLKTDRDLMYVHLKDLLPGCGNPIQQHSEYKFMRGISYYQEIKTSSINFFMERVPRGTYIFEYELYIDRPGTYTSGYSEAQCLYAPEFRGGSSSGSINVVANTNKNL